MKTSNVTIAGILMIVGGLFSLGVAVLVTVMSLFMWFPAYTCCVLLAIYAIVIGILLLAGVKVGPGIAISGAVAEILQILECDIIGVSLGIVALILLSRPESIAALTGQAQPRADGTVAPAPTVVPPGATGLMVHTSFIPLAFLLFFTHPVIVIRDKKHELRWGQQYVGVPPGEYPFRLFFPYIASEAGAAEGRVTVAEGHVTNIRYSAPFIVFMAGTVFVGNPTPNAASAAPAATPAAGEPPTQAPPAPPADTPPAPPSGGPPATP